MPKLPEPTEPEIVPESAENEASSDADGNAVEVLAARPGQVLVSTQTITHEYLTLNGKVARETVKNNGSVTDVMDFIYDESGRPFALNYSTDGGSSFTTYYYILNLQGDVVKLIRYIPGFEYEEVASYEYDAWGNLLSKSGRMAEKNPLRYRGYYYDNETGFYYLQSRYYDPADRRFVNADTYASTGQGFAGTNMFAYCLNNPVNRIDSGGTISIWTYLFMDSEFGWIHKCVQAHIVANNFGIVAEKGVYDSDGIYIGRVDVYEISSPKTKIWEVKSEKTQGSAYSQLTRYLECELKDSSELVAGDAGKFSDKFVVNCLGESYLITYDTPSEGVIIYHVKKIAYQEQCAYEYVPKSVRNKVEPASASYGYAPQGASARIVTTVALGGIAIMCGSLLYGSANSLGYRTARLN